MSSSHLTRGQFLRRGMFFLGGTLLAPSLWAEEQAASGISEGAQVPPSANVASGTPPPENVPAPVPEAHAPEGKPNRGDSFEQQMNASAPAAVSLPFLLRGSRESKKVSFTFDDGPTPGVTEMVLDALKKHDVKATFFMIGQRVKECPDLARRVRDEGHELANHSYTHPALGKMAADRVKSELDRCQEVIHATTGITPTWFRPPYGSFRQSQGPIAVAERLNVVIWSVDPRDWSRPGVAAIQNRVVQGTGNGDIILCHDLHKQTGQAADAMIAGVLQRGFQPVKLGELLLG